MNLPTPGITLSAKFVRVIDGDTVVLSLLDHRLRPHVRLLDTWADERNTSNGRAAKHYAEQVLEKAAEIWLHVPEPGNLNSLLANLSFDRILGYVFVTRTETLNEMLVANGFATKDRPGRT